VVDIAAGLASDGAAIPANAAEAKPAPDMAPPGVAQPLINALEANAPKGNMGAVARNLSAERREVRGVCDMRASYGG
jgi:hypothetical protein